MWLRWVACAAGTTEDIRRSAAEPALPADLGEACHEVFSLSSAVMENGTGSDSCEKKGQEGPWNHCLAGPISLVAQSGAKSKATAGLVFSAGPADSTGITSPRWLPRADRGRFVAAGGHAGGLHTGGSALTASSRLQTNQQRRNGNGRSLPGRLRPSIYPVSKLCSRSLLAGRLTLGRLGSRLGCAGLGFR